MRSSFLFFIGCILFVQQAVYAAVEDRLEFPRLPTKNFQHRGILFNQQSRLRPILYLLHNTSSQRFYFDYGDHHGMDAGWSSWIAPKHWSAILINKPRFLLTCGQLFKTKAGVKSLDCARLVTVYRVKPELPSHGLGTYWVAEDQPLATFYVAIKKRHIILASGQ